MKKTRRANFCAKIFSNRSMSPPLPFGTHWRGKKIGQTWARTSKRSLGERRKRAVRSRSQGEEAAPATGRRGGGAQSSSAAAKSTRRSFAPIAPSPFRAPLGCLAFLPESPVCKLADPGRSPESNKQLQAAPWSSASYKAEKQNQSSRLTVPVPSPRHHGSPPNPTLLSTDPNNTSQSNTLYWKGIVLRAPSLPLGPRAPIPRLSSDLSIGQLETGHPPPSQSANPPFSLPKLETQPLSPRDASSFQGVQSLPRPASEPLAPASSSRRGSCCATPSPPAHQSRGTRPGQLRSPCLPPSGQKKVGLLRAPRDNVESLGLPPFTPRGSRTSKARGEESRSPPAKPGGRTSRLPRCPEQSGAWGSLAPQPGPSGPGAQSTLPAGQWRSPLPALQSGRGWGGLGRFPPTLALESGAEAPAARVSCPETRHGAVPRPGLAAAGRHLRSGPVAQPARGRSRRGLVPEGDRSRARSRPPAGPSTASCRPAAPAPPRRPPWGSGKSPGFPRPAPGARGAAGRPL